jgi:hypothetical protein
VPVQQSEAEAAAVPVCVHAAVAQRPLTQLTEQHSALVMHAAPACVQKSGGVHFPPEQFAEQQSLPVEHDAPLAPHAGGGGAVHTPAVQERPVQQPVVGEQASVAWPHVGVPVHAPLWQMRPVQHWPGPVQAAPAGGHEGGGTSHFPLASQARPLAQSVLDVHAQPAGFCATAHASALAAQVPALQMLEQQSAAAEQAAPLAVQLGGGFPPGLDFPLHAERTKDTAATSSPIRSDAKRMLASLRICLSSDHGTARRIFPFNYRYLGVRAGED